MDRRAVELSRQALDVYSRETSEEYAELRKRLLGYLAAAGATAKDFSDLADNERNNFQLLVDFSVHLPSMAYFRLRTDDPFLIKLVQSNVLWVQEGFSSALPYYVIGKNTERKEGGLLLARVGDYSDPHRVEISTVAVNKKQLGTLDQLGKLFASEYPTPQDLKQMFYEKDRLFEVQSTSPGSVKLAVEKMHPQYHERGSIADEELAAFDVNSHMHRLATIFGFEEELDSMLAAHAEKRK